MRRTWIKIKRGILEPKHIEKLGQAWYLYFYILDQADWDSGTIKEWKDEYASTDLKKPIGLIREHRKHLIDGKYITCEKQQYGQRIIVHNWTNPKTYDGIVINKMEQSWDISECGNTETLGQSSGQSSGQTFSEQRENLHPSSSHTTTQSHTTPAAAGTQSVFSVYENNIGLLTPMISQELITAEQEFGPVWIVDAILEAVKANVRRWKYIRSILDRWAVEGRGAKGKVNKKDAIAKDIFSREYEEALEAENGNTI
jgi:DnaD/phage-associated family protein